MSPGSLGCVPLIGIDPSSGFKPCEEQVTLWTTLVLRKHVLFVPIAVWTTERHLAVDPMCRILDLKEC